MIMYMVLLHILNVPSRKCTSQWGGLQVLSANIHIGNKQSFIFGKQSLFAKVNVSEERLRAAPTRKTHEIWISACKSYLTEITANWIVHKTIVLGRAKLISVPNFNK
mmetsp:Transcript_11846/g.17088  ORF Transcript_11846/g.17088 Transcript_11846/m.17088 type:complete len:107 (+) Transcript_11846:1052-1372(+)